jgi:starch phosphorylase
MLGSTVERRWIAYFSMEIGVESAMPTYSGGLGVLAGDTVRSAADLKIPMVAVTLLHRHGYFKQALEPDGRQIERAAEWAAEDFLSEMPQRVPISLESRTVQLRCWRYLVRGVSGHEVPIYFLDTSLPENTPYDRTLSGVLYGGDERFRLCQEVILGIGGVKMLRALGYRNVARFHMNEGHSSLLAVELLQEQGYLSSENPAQRGHLEAVRNLCVFTTHTPVPAGHDHFPMALAAEVLPEDAMQTLRSVVAGEDGLNMTHLGFRLSRYVNGVARKHRETSRLMFRGYDIHSITNGVHAATWTSEPFQALFDRHLPGWREDNFTLRGAVGVPLREIWNAHLQAKQALLRYVEQQERVRMDTEALTLGYARRAASYKRADLLFQDVERLRAIVRRAPGPLQLIYAGKAHPRNVEGKEVIQRIVGLRETLREDIKLVYLEEYDMRLGRLITSGVDVWLNHPEPPQEASGTSGMKAALNGVPSLSILDGWWVEGHIEGVTGWAIGNHSRSGTQESHRAEDAAALYDKLEHTVIPLYYHQWDHFMQIMRNAIAKNGSFFNTQRMLMEYVIQAYLE